ncbi:MAG: hypothetical protein ACOC0P_04570 [Planctomycetota bacterium]
MTSDERQRIRERMLRVDALRRPLSPEEIAGMTPPDQRDAKPPGQHRRTTGKQPPRSGGSDTPDWSVLTADGPSLKDLVVSNLRERHEGIVLCSNCGYDLFRSVSNRCPECGQFLTSSNLQDRRFTTRSKFDRIPSWLRWMTLGTVICTTLMVVSSVNTNVFHGIALGRIIHLVIFGILVGCCYGAISSSNRDRDDGVFTTIGIVASGIACFTTLLSWLIISAII